MIIVSIAIVGSAGLIYLGLSDVAKALRGIIPDQHPEYLPDKEEDGSFYHGSESLHEKNDAFDERIRLFKEELGSEAQQIQNVRAGVLFEEDHAVVDSQYIPKPKHEYAE